MSDNVQRKTMQVEYALNIMCSDVSYLIQCINLAALTKQQGNHLQLTAISG